MVARKQLSSDMSMAAMPCSGTCVCVCAFVCVCVCEREREREREGERGREEERGRERERGKEEAREGGREGGRERERVCVCAFVCADGVVVYMRDWDGAYFASTLIYVISGSMVDS